MSTSRSPAALVTTTLLFVTSGALLPWSLGKAGAQAESELAAPRATATALAVEYAEVDLGTARVFSIRNVELTQVRGKRHSRDLALPVAGHGSGFFVDERGLLVTAEHVVRGRSHVAVHAFGEDEARPAKVVYTDRKSDLAILQTLGPARAPVGLAASTPALRIRDRVHAVGYPVDAARMDPQSSQGIVAGILPDGRLQLSISVNPGNSGGPLVDEEERVIGMIVARGRVERGVQGIGVAVPIHQIVEAIALVERHGVAERALAELERDRDTARVVARAVDALVSDVAPRALNEAWNAEGDEASLASLQSLERIASTATDPDLLAMLAAYFWNASILVVERAGGALGPEQMTQGARRELASHTRHLAIVLCHKAHEKDASIATRSPFVEHVIRRYPRRDRPRPRPTARAVRRAR